ncbi:MAG: N-acetyltransferase [Anaerolineae bacterium]|nr:N-acetyltransferase [Anaerolineae bacterium]
MDLDLSQVEVVHNATQKRFEIQIGDQIAMVKYILGSKEIIFTHTEVPEAFEGQGVASKIAKVAVDYAKAQGLRIRAMCPYVSAWIKRHPEYHSITAGYENESA